MQVGTSGFKFLSLYSILSIDLLGISTKNAFAYESQHIVSILVSLFKHSKFWQVLRNDSKKYFIILPVYDTFITVIQ